MKSLITLSFIFICNVCFSQTILKIASNYYVDYYKDKTIAQQGEATYIITFNNPLKIVRVQGPNSFDITMAADNFNKDIYGDNDYEMNWTVIHESITGFLLIFRKDERYPDGVKFLIYQIYKDGRYRIYSELNILQ